MVDLTVTKKTNLAPNDSGGEVFLMSFQGEDFQFSPGDWLAIKGRNTSALVDEFLSALGLSGSIEFEFKRLGRLSLQTALIEELELTFLDPALLNRLERKFSLGLWADRRAMQEYAEKRDVLDLVEEYPQIRSLGLGLVELLAPLYPRYYSITNAWRGRGEVSILFKKVVNFYSARERFGVTSSWLAGLKLGEKISVEHKPNSHFGLPGVGVPIVMLGAGTGLAPYLSFIEQRELDQADNNWLIFGETNSKTRFLMKERLLSWVDLGVLELDTAFSRDATAKVYVQDKLLEKSDKWLQLWEAGAITYVCGGRDGLGVGVEQAIKQIWAKAYGFSLDEQASAWADARKAGRIRLDLY